ncbi:hypothetical protein BESB_058920 [Besnoitia besnoiti]|uniref:Transmembrane protein n=1 Tax=Besnoitia besnoiti TaxID=94643 RepID=A0A2A9MAJ2_BESBE|nr:hypothetical protein BESB_058920 [Besnoitia besnoiti]PFH35005.1 hypothetical protein BESB_058920 [Besnoitia besnoiti]
MVLPSRSQAHDSSSSSPAFAALSSLASPFGFLLGSVAGTEESRAVQNEAASRSRQASHSGPARRPARERGVANAQSAAASSSWPCSSSPSPFSLPRPVSAGLAEMQERFAEDAGRVTPDAAPVSSPCPAADAGSASSLSRTRVLRLDDERLPSGLRASSSLPGAFELSHAPCGPSSLGSTRASPSASRASPFLSSEDEAGGSAPAEGQLLGRLRPAGALSVRERALEPAKMTPPTFRLADSLPFPLSPYASAVRLLSSRASLRHPPTRAETGDRGRFARGQEARAANSRRSMKGLPAPVEKALDGVWSLEDQLVQEICRRAAEAARVWSVVSPCVGCVCLYLVVSPLLTFCNKLLYQPSIAASPITCTVFQQILIVAAFLTARWMYRRVLSSRAQTQSRLASKAATPDASPRSLRLAACARTALPGSPQSGREEGGAASYGETRHEAQEKSRQEWPPVEPCGEPAGWNGKLDERDERGAHPEITRTYPDSEKRQSGAGERRRGGAGDLGQRETPTSGRSLSRSPWRVLPGLRRSAVSAHLHARREQLLSYLSGVPAFSQEVLEMCGPVVLPYALMLTCSNLCLYTSALSGYHVARCSSIPVQLFLELLGVDLYLEVVAQRQSAAGERASPSLRRGGRPSQAGGTAAREVAMEREEMARGTDAASEAAGPHLSAAEEARRCAVLRSPARGPGDEIPTETSQGASGGERALPPACAPVSRELVGGGEAARHPVEGAFTAAKTGGGSPPLEKGFSGICVRPSAVKAFGCSLLLGFRPFLSWASLQHVSSLQRIQTRLQALGVSRQRLAACLCVSVGVFWLAIDSQKLSLDGALTGFGASFFGALYMQLSSHVLEAQRARAKQRCSEDTREDDACLQSGLNARGGLCGDASPQRSACRQGSNDWPAGGRDPPRSDGEGESQETRRRSAGDGEILRCLEKTAEPRGPASSSNGRTEALPVQPSRSGNDSSEEASRRESNLEADMALHVAAAAAVLLIPLVVFEHAAFSPQASSSDFPSQASFWMMRWTWTRPVMCAGLLLASGLLAALLPVTSYFCFRHLSPLSCCIVGFFKSSIQILCSPLLIGEGSPSLSARLSAGLCLLGCAVYAFDSYCSAFRAQGLREEHAEMQGHDETHRGEKAGVRLPGK